MPADTKPYVEPDAVIGYRYTPGARMTLGRPGGGQYEIAVNGDGIRSDRDYSRQKPAGITRIIVLGDSMAAGQFVSNGQRFSELLERRHPGLEVINLALEGSGTDQQLLLYERVGLKYEHDVVLLLPFLQNIRRNMASAREAVDPATGAVMLRPKPYFTLDQGSLVFHAADPNAVREGQATTDTPPSALTQLKTWVSNLPGAGTAKQLLFAVKPWEPFPEYQDANGPAWQLMRAIVLRLKALAGPRPLVIAPTFYSNYVRYRMAANYRDRFQSLAAEPGIHFVDLLPAFRGVGDEAIRCFQDPYDMHFSSFGHLVLADALQAELPRLGLLAPA